MIKKITNDNLSSHEAIYEDQASIGNFLRKLLILLLLTSEIYYFGWRWSVINHGEVFFSSLLFISELYFSLTMFLFVIASWRIKKISVRKPSSNLKVDVFIPTYNEPLSVVRRTLIAAKNLSYPHQTYLLDDGNRKEFKNLATEIGCHYIARESNIHAKAGNLNNALKYSTGDFIAMFDADHVAEPNFIDETLGYFNDPKMAFVQTPQDFYNLNSFEHFNSGKPVKLIWDEQNLFYRLMQAGKDTWNGMHLCGCSAVVRRSAIEDIGGFAVETVTEDFHTSLRLHKRGYHAVYHNKPLAFGIAAGQLDVFQTQRFRWQHGNLHACRIEKMPFTRNLGFLQRLSYGTVLFSFLLGWVRLAFYIIPILVLFFGLQPIVAPINIYLRHFLPLLFLSYLTFIELGRGHARFLATEHFGMASFFPHIIASFGLAGTKSKFKVTPKSYAGKFPIYNLIPQISILCLGITAILYGLTHYFIDSQNYKFYPLVAFWTLTNSFFAFTVIHSAIRCLKNDETDYQFAVPMPIILFINNEFVTVRAEFISGNKALLKLPQEITVENINGSIPLPYTEALFTAQISKTNNSLVELNFSWQNSSHFDALENCLHHCNWHRYALNQRGYIKTPLFMLYELGLKLSKKRQAEPKRHIVYYDQKNQLDGSKRLGILVNMNCSNILLTFETLDEYKLTKIYSFDEIAAYNISRMDDDSNHVFPDGLLAYTLKDLSCSKEK